MARLPTTIRPTSAPNLPLAPVDYHNQYIDQLNNVLRLYMLQNDANSSALLGRLGGQYLTFPYGSFYDTTTHTAVSTSAAYPVTFNSNYDEDDTLGDGITIDPAHTSRVNLAFFGSYKIEATLNCTTTAAGYLYTWFRVGGVNLAQTASRTYLAASGDAQAVVRSHVFHIPAPDYVEVVFAVSNTNITLTPVVATAPVPAIPSATVNVTFVSGTHT